MYSLSLLEAPSKNNVEGTKVKKWHLIAIVILVVSGFWISAYHLRIFPDPYHRNGNVNIYEWIYREADELLHGEKD